MMNFAYHLKKIKKKKAIKEKYYKKCCCFFLSLKNQYRNDDNIIKEINEIKEEKKALDEKLELLTDYYMSQKEKEINKDLYSCISMKSLLILILSVFHFYAIAEIHGFLFSLFGEIKRSSTQYYNGNYPTNKTFSDFFTNSTLTDSSQINFNYFTSIFTSYFICRFSIMSLYAFSSLVLFGIIYLISIFQFLDKEQINPQSDNNYNKSLFILIIGYYLAIYFFAGLIALLPYELIKVNKKINSWDLLLMNFILTFSVIVKNLLHDNFELFKSPFICGLFYISSSFIYFIYPFIIWIQNKFKDNKNNKLNIIDNKNEDKFINIENNYIKKTNAENYQNDFKEEDDEMGNIFGNVNTIKKEELLNMLDDNQEQKSNNINGEVKKNIYFKPYYIFGYLIIKFDQFIITIKIKSIMSYICTILSDSKIILILIINLLSRAQKLKFKTIYKSNFNKSIYYLINIFCNKYFYS